MTTLPQGPFDPLLQTLPGSWQRFLDVYEPLRPDLYRYCRYLTRSPWDAEDLAQDALARAFASLARMTEPPRSPKAWLFRVAYHLWIDRVQKLRELPVVTSEPTSVVEPRDQREAAGTLIGKLAPQERAAVVLKDVFALTLDEIAEALATTTGAVKAALHRGRGKLSEPELPEPAAPDRAVIDAFCAAFNARDIPRLTALLLDTAAVEVVGTHIDYGPDAAVRGALHGMLFGSQRMAAAETEGGIEARFVQGVLPESPRADVRVHRGEPLLLLWYAHEDGEAVRAINRVECDGPRVCRLKNYFFSPEFIAEVCAELGVPFRSNGYKSCLSTLGAHDACP